MTDPLTALRQLAGEALALKDLLAERVSELQSWRYESVLGAEQLRSELVLLERSLDRAQKFALDLARLDLASTAARGADGEPRPIRLEVVYVNDWRRVLDGAVESIASQGGGGSTQP